MRIAPDREVGFLEAYLERFLVENMKRILRAKHSGEFVDKNSLISIPKRYEYVDLQAMSDAPTLQDAVDSLKKTSFSQLGGVMPLYRKYNLISLLEAALDKIYFDTEVRPKLDHVPDREMVEEMLAVEVDLTIIRILIDLRQRGIPPEAVESIIAMPINIRRGELQLISEANPELVPEAISRTRYANLAQPVRDALNPEKEESLDSVFRSEMYVKSRSLMAHYGKTFAYVLGYIRTAEAEANNLLTIVASGELGVSESKTEAILLIN